MSNIATKLSEISAVKSALKGAIASKGIDMTNVPFNNYPEKINEITTGVDESILLDIKQSIENKGVDMTNVSYDEYASKIGEITVGDPIKDASIKKTASSASSTSVSVNGKFVAISASLNYWESSTLTVKITIGGTQIACNNTNGTLVEVNNSGVGAGRRIKMLLWLNNKEYKDSTITKIWAGSTDGDSRVLITAIGY